MSKVKKLELSFEQLCMMAEAINKNREENKNRSKEDKVDTDTFVRKKFKIDRRDFSFSIKGTGIQYNPRTYAYEIPNYESGTNVINGKKQENSREETCNTKVLTGEVEEIKEKDIEVKKDKSNTFKIPNKIEEIAPVLLEMVEWYKLQKKESKEYEVESINNVLAINQEKFTGEIKGHTIKCYEDVYKKFKDVCGQYKSIKDQDLVSLALLEFINKYKK